MSLCIMSYTGPSSLTPEDTLLQMYPLDQEEHYDRNYIYERNQEYLIRSRRKGANMLKIDSKRLSKEQMTKGPGKDYFLVEVKGFDKQTSQKPEVDGNADKHEFVLICPQGSGKPSGKRVQLNQKVSSRDYMIQENMMNNMVENDNYMQNNIDYQRNEMMQDGYGMRYQPWQNEGKNTGVMNPLCMEYDTSRMYYKTDMQNYGNPMDMRHPMEMQRMRMDDKMYWMNQMNNSQITHHQQDEMKDGMGLHYGKSMSGMMMNQNMPYEMRGGMPNSIILPGISQIEDIQAKNNYKFDFNNREDI